MKWEDYLEVNEEDNDTEVHEGVRRRDKVRFLVQHKDYGRYNAGLGGAGTNNNILKLNRKYLGY